jgi:hypothetical protein
MPIWYTIQQVWFSIEQEHFQKQTLKVRASNAHFPQTAFNKKMGFDFL